MLLAFLGGSKEAFSTTQATLGGENEKGKHTCPQ